MELNVQLRVRDESESRSAFSYIGGAGGGLGGVGRDDFPRESLGHCPETTPKGKKHEIDGGPTTWYSNGSAARAVPSPGRGNNKHMQDLHQSTAWLCVALLRTSTYMRLQQQS